MATLTVYPNADGDSSPTTVDGHVGHSEVNLTWATLRASAGSFADDVAVAATVFLTSDANFTDRWKTIGRPVILLDASDLPDNAVVTSAILYLYGVVGLGDDLGISPSYNIYASAPTSDTALVAGDFDSFSSVPLCDTAIAHADWNVHNTDPSLAENSFTLNAAGLALISNSIVYLGVREVTYDVGGATPAWTINTASSISISTAEEAGVGDRRPKLVITYGYTYPTLDPIGAITRVTGLVHRCSTGPNPVYQLELIQGGLSSQYFSPISAMDTPTPTIPTRETREASIYEPTLLDYGRWLSTHTHEEQVAIFGFEAVSFARWSKWYKWRRRAGLEF